MRTALAILLLAPCGAAASDPFAPGVAIQRPGEGVAGLREAVRHLKAGMDYDAVVPALPAGSFKPKSATRETANVRMAFRVGKTHSLELEFRQTKIVGPGQSGLIRAVMRRGDQIIVQVGG